MKVIDLLNKIANDDKFRPNIKFRKITYIYREEFDDYKNDNNGNCGILNGFCINMILNDEVEIIEEDKKIEKVLDIELLGGCDNWIINPATNTKQGLEINPYILEAITRNFKELYHKQCELIDEVNKLKDGNNDR